MSKNKSDLTRRVFGLPQTAAGRSAVYLCMVFFVLFGVWLVYMELRPIQRPTFFSDPLHAVVTLSAAASAITGGLSGGFALTVGRERSILTFASILAGAFIAPTGKY